MSFFDDNKSNFSRKSNTGNSGYHDKKYSKSGYNERVPSERDDGDYVPLKYSGKKHSTKIHYDSDFDESQLSGFVNKQSRAKVEVKQTVKRPVKCEEVQQTVKRPVKCEDKQSRFVDDGLKWDTVRGTNIKNQHSQPFQSTVYRPNRQNFHSQPNKSKQSFGCSNIKYGNNSKEYQDFLIDIINSSSHLNTQNWDVINSKFIKYLESIEDVSEWSVLMNLVIRFSLHEILQHPDVYDKFIKLQATGEFKFIHNALWPDKKWFNKCKCIQRTFEDVFKTVKIIMSTGRYNIFEKNKMGENVLDCIMEANRNNRYSPMDFQRIYDYFTLPDDKLMNLTCMEIFNKITESNFIDFREPLCWLFSLPTNDMSKAVFDKLQFIKKVSRDANTGLYKDVKDIVGIFERLREGPRSNTVFDRFFTSTSWNPNAIDSMYVKIVNYFLKFDLTKAHNTEIVGGLIGELGTLQQITEYCDKVQIEFPETVMTCIAHAYPRFKDQCMLTQLVKMYENTKGKVKFNIQTLLNYYNVNLSSKPNMTSDDKSETVPTKMCTLKKSEEEEEEGEIEPIYNLTLTRLNQLSADNESLQDFNTQILEIASQYDEFITKYSPAQICYTTFVILIESVRSDVGIKAIPVLLKFLMEVKGLKQDFVRIYKLKIESIFKLSKCENPKWGVSVKAVIDSCFK